MDLQKLKEVRDSSLGEFYHEDGYYVNEILFLKDNLEYSHTVYAAYKRVNGEIKTWNISPYEFIGKVMHMDEVCDLIAESRC